MAIVAIVTGSVVAVYAERVTIRSGLASLRQSNLGWVVAGFGAECISMAAFALLQQRLLGAAGTRLTFGSLLAIAYTSSAVSLAVPVAGSAWPRPTLSGTSARSGPIPPRSAWPC